MPSESDLTCCADMGRPSQLLTNVLDVPLNCLTGRDEAGSGCTEERVGIEKAERGFKRLRGVTGLMEADCELSRVVESSLMLGRGIGSGWGELGLSAFDSLRPNEGRTNASASRC